jgi:hypothetical protein
LQVREIASAINDWPVELRHRFYVCLAHNLTITGRVVWSDEQLKSAETVVRLKALNELMHRVLGQAMGDDTWPASQFVGEYLLAFAEEQRDLAGDLGFAVRSAYESVAAWPAE